MKKTVSFLALLMILLPLASAQVTNPTTSNYLPITENSNIIIKSVNYDPAPAEPGNYVDIFVVIQNLGNRDLSKSYLKLEEEYPFSFNSPSDSIEEVDLIPSGREELLEFRMLVDDQAVEGDYTLEVIQCSDPECENEVRNALITIQVKTGGRPKLEIGLEDAVVFLPGTLGDITISAVNKGKLGMKFLTLELLEGEGYEVISPSRVYVGELDSDDFETEDFQIFVSSDSPVNIPVKVEYSDINFKDYAGVENIELKVFTQEQAESMGLVSSNHFVRNLFIFLVVVGFLFFLYRRRKKKNEA